MEDFEPKRRGRPPMVRSEAIQPAPVAVEAVQVRVVRDFWTEEGRVRAGSLISVSVQDALRGVKNGSLDPIED